VNWKQLLDCFDFDNDFIFHNEIQPVPAVEFDIFVNYWQWLLLFHFQAKLLQFKSKTCLISRFQQPWSEMPMNLDGGADDAVRNLIETALSSISRRSLRLGGEHYG